MIEKKTIATIVSDYCAEAYPDYYIVEVAVHPGNRIVVELGASQGLSIDACVAISKHIEGQLDREIDAVGQEVEVLRKGGVKEKGLLKSVDEAGIILEVLRKVRPEGQKRKVEVAEELSIPFSEVLQTKRQLKF